MRSNRCPVLVLVGSDHIPPVLVGRGDGSLAGGAVVRVGYEDHDHAREGFAVEGHHSGDRPAVLLPRRWCGAGGSGGRGGASFGDDLPTVAGGHVAQHDRVQFVSEGRTEPSAIATFAPSGWRLP